MSLTEDILFGEDVGDSAWHGRSASVKLIGNNCWKDVRRSPMGSWRWLGMSNGLSCVTNVSAWVVHTQLDTMSMVLAHHGRGAYTCPCCDLRKGGVLDHIV